MLSERAAAHEVVARLEAMFQATPTAVVALDAEGHVTAWNPAAERLYGTPAAEALGAHLTRFVPSHAVPHVEELLARTLAGERTVHETRRRAADGRMLDVVIETAPLRDDAGHPLGGVGFVRDVTAVRAAERAATRRAREQTVLAELAELGLRGAAAGVIAERAVGAVREVLGADGVALHRRGRRGVAECARSGTEAPARLLAELPVVLEAEAGSVVAGEGAVVAAAVVVPGPDGRYGVLSAWADGRAFHGESTLSILRATAGVLGAVVARRPVAGPAPREITLRGAADLVGVSVSTLRRWIDDGRVEAVRTHGGHRRVRVDDVRRLIASGVPRPRPVLRRATPVPDGVPVLAEALVRTGSALIDQAIQATYVAPDLGWFATPAARGATVRWLAALAAAAAGGPVARADTELGELLGEAERAGTSLLERHAFVEAVGQAALRAVARETVAPADHLAARRLLRAQRELVLLDRPGREA
jgi:PAS domain S-box-containing protein/excisionase family DNA binding protein